MVGHQEQYDLQLGEGEDPHAPTHDQGVGHQAQEAPQPGGEADPEEQPQGEDFQAPPDLVGGQRDLQEQEASQLWERGSQG